MYESLMATRQFVEANDALLATLWGYDVLWDGVLPPEIVDAEFYDCPNLMGHIDLPYQLLFQRHPVTDIVQQRDHREALKTLIATVCEIAILYLDAPFLEINLDGSFHDCQLKSEELFGFAYLFGPPADFPR